MPRIIYSLQFDLFPRKPGELAQLIAPLDARGQSPHCKAEPPKQRVIDLRVGDWVRHRSGRYRVQAIRAYRDNFVDDSNVPAGDGYLVKGS